MEEKDIKILKEMMKEVKEEAISYDKYCYEVEVKQVRAIENLLKAYRELEKENEELKKEYSCLIDKIENKIDKFDYEFEKAKRKK